MVWFRVLLWKVLSNGVWVFIRCVFFGLWCGVVGGVSWW